jgi:alginate O-acetyltransferase complex protein AlgI
MVFSSTVFLFIFLPAVYLLHLVMPYKFKLKNLLLLVASLLFYAWGEPVYVFLMCFSILANYLFVLWMDSRGKPRGRKFVLALSIVLNLLLLGFFKYANFFVGNVNALLGTAIAMTQIPLPIGISFYTFHAISYAMDVYRGRTKAQKNPVNVALYISFFPQLVAGPIIRYHDIHEQLEKRQMTVEKTASGVRRFILGLSKKLLVANVLGALADQAFALPPGSLNIALAWLGAIAYALQIYFDFSGYSDMAIGLGRMFGFEIMENFNFPYISRSIKEFWKRWHISLTNWFREYLYFPLGGNRKGLARTCVNMTIVFFCTAFWHGAAWTFLAWGLTHGFFMILETLGVIKPEKFRYKWMGSLYMLVIVITTFVIFRSDSFAQAWGYMGAMFTGFDFGAQRMSTLLEMLSPVTVITLAAAIAGSMPVIKTIRQRMTGRAAPVIETAGFVASFVLLALCVLALSSSSYNPFIYFRF